MSTLDPKKHHQSPSVKEGYEVTDVSTSGILVFLVALAISVGVFFVFCFGMGKVINNAIVKKDGPATRYSTIASTPQGKLRNLESSAELQQQQLHLLTQRFPTPRLETDDGNQDLADLHDREDLMLNYYSWVNQAQGSVRIPIDQAMQLIAQRGLPVAQQQPQQAETLMAGDSRPVVQMPLTDGFAPTAYEQEEHGPVREPGEQASTKAQNQ